MIRNSDKMESKKNMAISNNRPWWNQKYPKHLQQQITSSIFRNIERKDLYVNGQTIVEHFRNKERSAGVVNFKRYVKILYMQNIGKKNILDKSQYSIF